MANQETATLTQIRWMIRRDMPRVLEIENQSYEYAWTEDEFLSCLRQRTCIGMVAETKGQIAGIMIYELQPKHLNLITLTVAPEFRRQGYGAAFVAKLVAKLDVQRRRNLIADVRESNLPGHLFMRAVGLRAIDVIRRPYANVDEDAYRFEYRLGDTSSAKCNRIAGLSENV